MRWLILSITPVFICNCGAPWYWPPAQRRPQLGAEQSTNIACFFGRRGSLWGRRCAGWQYDRAPLLIEILSVSTKCRLIVMWATISPYICFLFSDYLFTTSTKSTSVCSLIYANIRGHWKPHQAILPRAIHPLHFKPVSKSNLNCADFSTQNTVWRRNPIWAHCQIGVWRRQTDKTHIALRCWFPMSPLKHKTKLFY